MSYIRLPRSLWILLSSAPIIAHAVHALLQKYGGIVRIHPNQVAFLDQGVARFVYNKFPKSAWYDGMKTNEGDNSMSLR